MNNKFKTKPYKHQLTALEKSWNRESYAYFMEMGTGKTKVLIDNMSMLYDKGKINGPGENIICDNSGNKNSKSPYSLAPIIFILGLPSAVPAIC